MSTGKIIDGKLALIAVQRYRSDEQIRNQYSSASQYLEALEALKVAEESRRLNMAEAHGRRV